ncbi:hypothetical protein TIFTF001_004863 [Ficus carica]|uniref:Uncharacterized protein n=1 Tax=Ficus carica TaxID=3494 RepID=A0AA88CWQ8_FICCA|nr:hypothetical protein TIFTF001_004863 [Ficus carica]
MGRRPTGPTTTSEDGVGGGGCLVVGGVRVRWFCRLGRGIVGPEGVGGPIARGGDGGAPRLDMGGTDGRGGGFATDRTGGSIAGAWESSSPTHGRVHRQGRSGLCRRHGGNGAGRGGRGGLRRRQGYWIERC